MATVHIPEGSALHSCSRDDLPGFFSIHYQRFGERGLRAVINIRESIGLASRLIREALAFGLIDAGGNGQEPGRLLVIGGGPAGISAAMAASRAGVPVTLLE
jgi:threonine dehydrogenase-like Zn-dependent dehydrogenase